VADLVNELAWSFTRHQTLLECPRRYHFRHYAFWGGWERNAAPDVREVYRLTKLEHRATWQGKVVHEAIARALQRARRGAPVTDVGDYVDSVLVRMREDYRASRDDRARKTGRFKDHVRFFEHEEGTDDGGASWRARWKETADTVASALRGFFESEVYQSLCRLPAEDWLEIEEPSATVGASFFIDGVRVYVKVDCAFRDAGRAVVLDWKTGRTSSPLTPLQLAAYALYLADRHGIELGSVIAREVNVVTGQTIEHDVSPEALDVFREVFAASVERMRGCLVDVAGNVPKPAGSFPYTQDDRHCRDCNFRSICPKTSPAF